MPGKHALKAYLWVQDEIRSQRIQAHTVRSEESAADLGKEPLSRVAILKYRLESGHKNMKDEVSRMDDKQERCIWNSAQQWVPMSRSQAVMISRNCRIRSRSSSSWLHGLRVGEERLHEVGADGDGLLNAEEGNTSMGLVDKTTGTKIRSSMVLLWKRDPNLVDTLDTDGNGKVSLHEIFDGIRVAASL